MSKAILVTGATGKQGGSLINALLKANADFEILAVTRDANSQSAQKLAKKSPSIKLVTGNLDAVEDIFKTASQVSKTPIWGVYSVQAAIQNNAEEAQGKALVDAATKHGVQHFVYSSVDRGGNNSEKDPTNVPHFITKHEIEQHLFSKSKDGSMTYTVLRPVAFYDNLVPGFMGKVFSSSWQVSLRPEQKLQLVATSDIGFFASQAFINPEQYRNRGLTLVGDELTYNEFASIFKEETGREMPTTFSIAAKAINWMVKDLGYMFKWFRDVGYGGDIAEMKRLNPEMKDFRTWLRTESQFETRK